MLNAFDFTQTTNIAGATAALPTTGGNDLPETAWLGLVIGIALVVLGLAWRARRQA